MNISPKIFFFLFFVLLFHSQAFFAQSKSEATCVDHEITIFAIPEVRTLAWDNPSVLFKSALKCYTYDIFSKNYYVIGHIIARINSPLLDSAIYVAMNGAEQMEKVKIVLKNKVGLGALGSTIKGRMEPYDQIQKAIELYSKRNKIAYLKFKVNNEAIERLLEFVNYYQTKNEFGFAPCDFYNGALWPRYENEGSGCSAFAMTLLDIANVLPDEAYNEWIMSVDVPMNLIGGEFNGNKKVKYSEMLKTKSWYKGEGKEGVDYVNYKVFDPGKIFNWINNRRLQNDTIYMPESENQLNGLVVNCSYVTFDMNDNIIHQRKDRIFFAKFYYEKILNAANKTQTASEKPKK